MVDGGWFKKHTNTFNGEGYRLPLLNSKSDAVLLVGLNAAKEMSTVHLQAQPYIPIPNVPFYGE